VDSTSGHTRDSLRSLTTDLIERAQARGIAMRALGGLAIDMRATDMHPLLRREFADVDVVVPKRARRQLADTMEEAGLRPELQFNALHGSHRQIWWTPDHGTHIDVFVGEFTMCHRLDLDDRLNVDHPALPAADLLLMKLQVVELNHKDVTDAAALLSTHELGEHDENGSLNRHRLTEVLSSDWGFYTTVTDNLERIPGLVSELDAELGRQVERTAEQVREEVDRAPKSRAFKLRGRVGRRKRWYELPEEPIT